jgi:hypothetical protein
MSAHPGHALYLMFHILILFLMFNTLIRKSVCDCPFSPLPEYPSTPA